MAEVAVPGELFAAILDGIQQFGLSLPMGLAAQLFLDAHLKSWARYDAGASTAILGVESPATAMAFPCP